MPDVPVPLFIRKPEPAPLPALLEWGDWSALPPPFDRLKVAVAMQHWQDVVARFVDHCAEQSVPVPDMVSGHPDVQRVLESCFGNSPFLTTCLLQEPAFFFSLFSRGPDAEITVLLHTLRQELAQPVTTPELMKALRVAKRRMSMLAGLADMAGVWDSIRVSAALSDFADMALRLCVAALLRAAQNTGQIDLPHADDPQKDCGYMILALGKLGAFELNYSSDIDLVVLYDEEKIRYRGRKSPSEFYVRLTRDLMRLLEERTADGYVFRTDLRLRPDPGSTALALSVQAAEIYYESFGQNWERAAMIKARPVAGDIVRGREFLSGLRPFVWRKSLDFNAIQDIHSIKRQIHAHKGGGHVAVAGHNIKLGRGGIREIEFFAQTQQLIWGGRVPGLRLSRTLDALDALADAGRITGTVRDDLSRCYQFLRTVEHRLQMIDDARTQTLPLDPERRAHLACFLGWPDLASFDQAMQAVLCTVEAHYAALFGDAPGLGTETPDGQGGSLVFTGHEDDPETLQTLSGLGYTNPRAIAAMIRAWHHGRYRVTRSTRAREVLTELVPTLLRALGKTFRPDEAFYRFDEFLRGLPAGIQIFSLLYDNDRLLDLLADIMGDAPRLAGILARRPGLFDAVMARDFLAPLPDRDALGADLDRILAGTSAFEDVLDLCRIWVNGRKFQVGVQVLRHMVAPRPAGEALTAVADVVLDRLLRETEREFSLRHGRVPGGALVVLALGKMGGREMTVTSDLDLTLLYDFPADCETSDGPVPLAASTWFIRLTQRFVNAVTAMTSAGILYEVDMRLRPSGSKGPLAVSLDAFVRYNAESAWTWERMAQTRARVVCGDPALARRVSLALVQSFGLPPDPVALLLDVADMRVRMARERRAANMFDVKLWRGGLVDIEFIVQYLLLRHANVQPAVLDANIAGAIDRLRDAGFLESPDADLLQEAQELWLGLQGILRYSIDGVFREQEAPPGLCARLAHSAGEPDFPRLKERMGHVYRQVSALFARLIEHPADQARRASGSAPVQGESKP
ncbi:bifunctional [glutamine synthetase] adenylyltransferase/[glutamine synthetase]-adenylyl-L-tyrosine phosphorylase [Haematospirillum jordaniae]|uniref:Bifunctional glutamine synthetase adenylyltransferase/adenylyl-removing enzyme n=1 Tax=Haematospirillum jordaniae TaxID=1549855 RepID=A0A143DE36_9PROT|nr:bifunctional [glutamine synthetase] adenylyltransferase/[glutamine synthetase]-adenylyl-L-tyrosine phosphorylase [Haematospirillum jordaniae]AMW34926.1 glutamine-synthetase adenylyltransferase [Haematospirillum jordaniae]